MTRPDERAEAARQARHYDALWRDRPVEVPEYVHRDPRRQLIGPISGRRLLDIGSGLGEWALHYVQCGAEVVACDLSEVAMRNLRDTATAQGLGDRLHVAVLDLHRLPFADATFDLMHGQFILHHLDLGRAAGELARVLKPGGVAVFCETWAANPLLMFARRHLVGRFGIPRWSVPGERPLGERDVARLIGAFGAGSTHHYEFHCFALIDGKLLGGRHLFGRLDALVYRLLPAARRYGYTVWLRLERRGPQAGG